jgi:hypothetical protein
VRLAGGSGAGLEEQRASGSAVWGAKLGSEGSPRRGRRVKGQSRGTAWRVILQARPATYHNSLSHSKLQHELALCGRDCTRCLRFSIASKWLLAAESTGMRWCPQRRAVPSASRVSEDIRDGWVLVPSGGALGTARPTFNRAGSSGWTHPRCAPVVRGIRLALVGRTRCGMVRIIARLFKWRAASDEVLLHDKARNT